MIEEKYMRSHTVSLFIWRSLVGAQVLALSCVLAPPLPFNGAIE
jgi:hypothetical protein